MLVAAAILWAPGCGGADHALTTRRADFRNVQNIMAMTSQQCRTAVAAMADAVRSALARSGSVAVLQQTAQASITACSQGTDEEIQDLATLSVPEDLRSLRLDAAVRDLTAWVGDAVVVAKDVIRLAQDRGDAAAIAEFNAKTSGMELLAHSMATSISSAATALKVPFQPIQLPAVGRPPGPNG